MRCPTLAAVSLLLALAIPVLAQTKPAAISNDDLHRLYDGQNYAELLKQLRVVLAAKDQSSYDRYDLLTLKGEALLHTKSDAQAADAFRDAGKAAKSDDQTSIAQATEYLIRKSHNESYTPRARDAKGSSGKPEPISLLETDSRRAAFAALLDDELADNTRDIESAKKATSLEPIVSVAPKLGMLQCIERAANGNADKTSDMAKQVGDHARELLSTATTKLATRIDELETKMTGKGSHDSGYHGKKFYTSSEVAELNQISSTCNKIEAVCADLGKSLGAAGGDFAGSAKTADDVSKHAEEAVKKHGPQIGAPQKPAGKDPK